MARKKDPNKMTKTFQIIIDDEMKARIDEAKKKGINIQPLARDALNRIMNNYEKIELFNY